MLVATSVSYTDTEKGRGKVLPLTLGPGVVHGERMYLDYPGESLSSTTEGCLIPSVASTNRAEWGEAETALWTWTGTVARGFSVSH